MSRFRSIGIQYMDSNGDPLNGGLLNFYESGTSTRKNTYSDESETIANPNPVILSADGRQPDIFFTGQAKCVLTDSEDVQIEVRDPIGGCCSVGAGGYWNFIFPPKTTDWTCVHGDFYFADVPGDTIPSITATLPASPSVGDRIGIRMLKGTEVEVYIDRNGSNIEGSDAPYVLSDAGGDPTQGTIMIYVSTAYGWTIMQNMNATAD